jgi:twitching motility protein PilT
MDIKNLLQLTIDRNASDLHLVVGYYPSIRIFGELRQFQDYPLLTPEMNQTMLFSLLNDELKENLLANKEIDFGYQFGESRFRINIYYAKNTVNASFRLIPLYIRTLEELSLPQSLYKFTNQGQGLVLITGPTGEGKSTTLASLINYINKKSSKHIITIEDPVEYVYPVDKSVISQRELHQDTHSWNISLRSALRQDPDVVLIGEMRDYETIQLAMTAAETGHLVFSTLHTLSAPDTISRIIDVFPSTQQNQIKAQLSSSLRAILVERLLPRIDKPGRIPCIEVLYNTPAISSIIRDGNYHLINNVLITSEAEGMILFEKYLIGLYREGKISKETAYSYAIRPKELEKILI